MSENIIAFIRKTFKTKNFIPLHAPIFIGNEKKYLSDCIDSTFISSVGKYVDEFEDKFSQYTSSKFVIATSSGTSALHTCLLIAGVEKNDEVITQPITFVATCNAISYCGASPIFVDVDRDTMGLSPSSLLDFLKKNTIIKNGKCINIKTGKIIKVCLPMHTYGHPCRIDEIREICDQYNITLIEDAAESVGSRYRGKHTGTFGDMGAMSFNGNKIISSGGGGCILTNDVAMAKRAKHLTTTAKVPHKWDFNHDTVGYNYRMPNLNAALLVAQLENLDKFIDKKRKLAIQYDKFFKDSDYQYVTELKESKSNYWLNSIILKNKSKRDEFLKNTNSNGIMTRPIWTLMHKLPMFEHAQYDDLSNSEWLSKRVVNLPSSVIT